MKNKKVVVILGTGATIASGYKKDGNHLPGDQGFFDNAFIKEQIKQYPALKIMMNVYKSNPPSLEAFWTFLDFCHYNKQLENLIEAKKELWGKIKELNQENRNFNELHCNYNQYISNKGEIEQNTSQIDILLLAGWELRLLINQVYSDTMEPKGDDDVYGKFLSKLEKYEKFSFITLNYDCFLERSLIKLDKKWYYPNVKIDSQSISDNSPTLSIPVIKIHGSLNWKMKGNSNFDISWNYENTEPIKHKSISVNDFEQSAIVAPLQVKADLHKPEMQNSIWIKLLQDTWKFALQELREADKIIIVGYSLPPTDYHVDWLLRRVKSEKLQEVSYCSKLGDCNIKEKVRERLKDLFSIEPKLFFEGMEDARFLNNI